MLKSKAGIPTRLNLFIPQDYLFFIQSSYLVYPVNVYFSKELSDFFPVNVLFCVFFFRRLGRFCFLLVFLRF